MHWVCSLWVSQWPSAEGLTGHRPTCHLPDLYLGCGLPGFPVPQVVSKCGPGRFGCSWVTLLEFYQGFWVHCCL